MIIIQKQNDTLDIVLERQALDTSAVYKVADFCVKSVVDGKTVVYHTLTGEICELDEKEAALLCDGASANEETKELIEHYFLVPEGYDEIELSNEVCEFIKLFKKKNGINNYTIFTTMDCNARCFYCFESGRPRTPMSLETARDIVPFIKQNANLEKPVNLAWFGGEPLYNKEVIDVITDGLRNEGIEFSSKMVSNGYLFDSETAKKAKNDWNLRHVQITLDGTEDVYNKSKSFIYGGNAFEVVTNNIENVLKEDIAVTIRINFGSHNKDDLKNLVEWIAQRYPEHQKLGVYAHLLFEYNDGNVKDDFRDSLAAELVALEDCCREKGFYKDKRIANGIRLTRCMADNDGSVTITPTGKLGKCEHFTEENFIGDIYSGIVDNDVVASFKERSNTKEICRGCSAYPTCIMLKKCPDVAKTVCNSAARKIEESSLERRLVYTYRKLKEKENKAE